MTDLFSVFDSHAKFAACVVAFVLVDFSQGGKVTNLCRGVPEIPVSGPGFNFRFIYRLVSLLILHHSDQK